MSGIADAIIETGNACPEMQEFLDDLFKTIFGDENCSPEDFGL